ncbi:M20/M25/M40 family metallo-hydrolase [Salisaeta longa]|uniref:M20/M25/M40 family metallo-hydrolase n=1 Tax=Salisaeta longa TaxID=503170 RepID=UPI0003FDD036|nr:M20/M25/M40 family metallo-hydrolase [Salisaeta longa]
MNKYLWSAVAALGGLAATVVGRAAWATSPERPSVEAADVTISDEAMERLAGALRHRTITARAPEDRDDAAYADFRAYLRAKYPRVHEHLTRSVVNGHSVLYTWPGSNAARAPLVFMAHYDVVPVDEPADWTHPPFGGVYDGTHVWGRGALDDKASVCALFEAVDQLLAAGYQPQRTIHLAIGHDEEVGGAAGASAVAARIAADGPPPALVVDEGGALTEGALPGIDAPIAFVGVAEKGYLSLALRATHPGGHSSVPTTRTSVDIITEAVQRLRNTPLPARLDGVTGTTFDTLTPAMPFVGRLIFANRWLFNGLAKKLLARRAPSNAAIRTTTAPTRLTAGVKDNVVPSTARATMNFRILPGQSVDDVHAHVADVLEDLPIETHVVQAGEPTPVAPTTSDAFALVKDAIHATGPRDVVVAPFVVPGTTDSRHYAPYTDRVYRFAPFRLTPDDQSRIHGVDERISAADVARMIAFYRYLMAAGDELPVRG